MQTLSLNVLTRLSRSRAPPALFTRAFGWNVGDAVPVNYMKDGKAPVIKEDTEYPDWVATLANPLQTKTQLLNKYNDPATDNKDMSKPEIMRLKRLITLTQIKDNNLASTQ